ncbi:hypothetical protein AB6D66_09010 [Vibrio pomeroyi]|uniref:Chromosome partitioning protein ParA n=1 Tax=Vibrio pomeroyi TaxID=198832 RepID=A0ABV4MV31_9VIBR
MKKVSILAAAIAVALTGCGSDSSNSGVTTPTEPSTTTNKFIDAAVEGIYYNTSSGLSGVTNSEGEFTAKTSDTVTFFIGGENGLKVGAASNRDVLTPFEAAGKYARALNLAILLQSLDNQFSSTSDEVLTIPDVLRAPDAATLVKMKDLSLDDRASVTDFLDAMGVDAVNITSEEEALTHMENAFGSIERGGSTANPFAEKDGKFVRYIDVTQVQKTNDYIYVHADKILPTELFEKTRGMVSMDYQVNNASLEGLAGSNDTSLREGKAEGYLNCLGADLNNTFDPSNNSCSGSTISDFTLNGKFEYMLLDPDASSTGESISWNTGESFLPFTASSPKELNHFTKDKLFNDGSDSNQKWVTQNISGSFDPVTQIYTEIVEKTSLNGNNCDQKGSNCSEDRTTERVAFYYEISAKGAEEYVDFTGKWQTKEICANGEIAVSEMNFDSHGAVTTGQECGSTSPKEMEDSGVPYAYSELANMDFWWFAQANRASKATLTELNTVVRFCDQDDFNPDVDSCSNGNEKFVKWEYQPSGKDWNEGLLIRRKMDSQGNYEAFSIMQKIN